jgi:hypothetical protein
MKRRSERLREKHEEFEVGVEEEERVESSDDSQSKTRHGGIPSIFVDVIVAYHVVFLLLVFVGAFSFMGLQYESQFTPAVLLVIEALVVSILLAVRNMLPAYPAHRLGLFGMAVTAVSGLWIAPRGVGAATRFLDVLSATRYLGPDRIYGL